MDPKRKSNFRMLKKSDPFYGSDFKFEKPRVLILNDKVQQVGRTPPKTMGVVKTNIYMQNKIN